MRFPRRLRALLMHRFALVGQFHLDVISLDSSVQDEHPAIAPTWTIRQNWDRTLSVAGFFRFIAYLAIILLAYVTINQFVFIDRSRLLWDEGQYAGMSNVIRLQGVLKAGDVLRTYGYPLFIAKVEDVVLSVFPQIPYIELITFTQFALHTVSAWLAVLCLTRWLGKERVRWWSKLLCFAVIEMAPMLLSLSKNFLPESYCAFLLTVFFYFLLTPGFRFHLFFASAALALAIVSNPFFGAWTLALIVIVGGIFLASKLVHGIAKLWRRQRISLPKKSLFAYLWPALQIVLPMFVILGIQYYDIFVTEGRFDLVGTSADYWQQVHLTAATYGLKYETFYSLPGNTTIIHSAALWYIADDAMRKTQALAQQTGASTPWSFAQRYPLDALGIFAVKTVGLFQNYEWANYRNSVEPAINYVFVYGFILFACFAYINVTAFLSVRFSLLEFLKVPPAVLVPLIGADLLVLIYGILTIPEGRFLVPALPIMISLAFYFVEARRNRMVLIVTALLAIVPYIWAFLTLALNQH